MAHSGLLGLVWTSAWEDSRTIPNSRDEQIGGKKDQNWGHSVNEEQKQRGDEVTLAQRGKASHLQRDLEWDGHPEHRLNRSSHGQMPPRMPRKTNVATET